MNNIPQIAVVYEEGHEQLAEIANGFVDKVISDDLDIRSESRPAMGPMACVEWYIPTAIFIFISKAYFDGFLKEMGKEHYGIVKNGISQLWQKLFGKDKLVSCQVIGTPGKITENFQYSLNFSILGEFKDKQTFKFLFEESISEIEFAKRIDLIMKFLSSIHTDPDNIQDYFVANNNAIVTGSTILIGYDPNSQKLINLDPREKYKPKKS